MNIKARMSKKHISSAVRLTASKSESNDKSISNHDVLRIIKNHKEFGVPFISRSHWLSSDLATKVSYMLNSLMRKLIGQKASTNTIFYNSDTEALSGAIRLSRLKGYNQNETKDILIYDAEGYYESFYNPTFTESNEALCPKIKITTSQDEFLQMIEKQPLCAAILIIDDFSNDASFIEDFLGICKQSKTTSIIFNNIFEITDLNLKSDIADVNIIGDILTSSRVPCSVSVIKNDTYQIWNNNVGSAVFMSTWAGNTLAMESIIQKMDKQNLISDNDQIVLDWISNQYENRVQAFREYSHPPLYDQINICGFSEEIMSSNGLDITLKSGRNIIDVGGSLGCSLGGDTSSDHYKKLLDEYDEEANYHKSLENLLTLITPFERVIPAVSGATAVEIAISFAMMANPMRSKIVTFNGNYSGKSLIAVNASKTSHIIVEPFPEALGPYYNDMVYIDPFLPGADKEVDRILSGGDVALVWFEITQGYMCEPIPKSVLEVIDDKKKEYGYVVGVDEVLTGMYRNGCSILSHTDQLRFVDVVSMSKASSDLTYPISWTLVKEDLYRKAKNHNSMHVAKLSQHYQYNLGSYIGIASLQKLIYAMGSGDFLKYQKEIMQGLSEVAIKSPVLAGVKCDGLLFRFSTNSEWFPYYPKSQEMTIVETVLTRMIIERCDVMLNNLRIFPPIIPDTRITEVMIKKLSDGLSTLEPIDVYQTIYSLMGSKIEETDIPHFIRKTPLYKVFYN